MKDLAAYVRKDSEQKTDLIVCTNANDASL